MPVEMRSRIRVWRPIESSANWFMLLLMVVLLQHPKVMLAAEMYWIDYDELPVDRASGTIKRANLDGFGIQTIVETSGASGFAVDPTGKLDWTERFSIISSNLDGSEIAVLLKNQQGIDRIVVHEATRTLYWDAFVTEAEGSTKRRRKLFYSNLDGTNIGEIVDASDSSSPGAFAIDPLDDKLYYVKHSLDFPHPETLRRANLDGTEVEDIHLGNDVTWDIDKLAVDPLSEKLYWTDGGYPRRIRRSNLDGSDVEDVRSDRWGRPFQNIAIDARNKKLYWIPNITSSSRDGYENTIKRSNLDGTDVEVVVKDLNPTVAIALRIVDSSWVSKVTGLWDAYLNWDGGIPSSWDAVRITPRNGLIVTGPTVGTSIRSLTLGASVGGVAELRIQSPGQINIDETLAVQPRGKVQIDGVISASQGVENRGDIQMVEGSQLNGGTLLNDGVIRGYGIIANEVNNNVDGEIRVSKGHRLHFSSGTTNLGAIQVLGGEVEFEEGLTNIESTGQIVARDAALRFGGSGLVNHGSVGFSFGTCDVFGDVTNSGVVAVSGRSQVTFFDDITNNATIRVSTGSEAVFFGSLSGGGIEGGGTVFIEGDLRPGHSSGSAIFFGDLFMGPDSTLAIEIGGTVPGVGYDQVSVIGALELDGELSVELIEEFMPIQGQVFEILIASEFYGTFNSVDLPNLSNGLTWDSTGVATSGHLRVVPEPTPFVLAIAGMLIGFGCCRRMAQRGCQRVY